MEFICFDVLFLNIFLTYKWESESCIERLEEERFKSFGGGGGGNTKERNLSLCVLTEADCKRVG